jgi:hypothetical protein
MKSQNRVRVEFVANVDAHACVLTKVLGEPQIERRGDKLFTSWVFEYPQGQRHWVVSIESELPVVNDGGCNQHEMLTWDIYGETEDREILQDLCRYLTGADVYNDAE